MLLSMDSARSGVKEVSLHVCLLVTPAVAGGDGYRELCRSKEPEAPVGGPSLPHHLRIKEAGHIFSGHSEAAASDRKTAA